MSDIFEREDVAFQTDDREYIDFFPPQYRIGRTKYIVITGGVMSGVGKGVFTASLAHLLKHRGFSVTTIKMDGYLNIDAGTLNPYRHGETFVLADGTECDMDLGTYERFLDEDLDSRNYITSGKVYSLILRKEREGKYLGRDVLVIPHVTGEIKYMVRDRAKSGPFDIVLLEIGGTVGDIENLHFIEAARELMHDEGRDNVMFVHVTMVPYSEATGEQKSKPTQHSVKALQELGVQPDVIVCRSKQPIQEKVRQKISLYCNIPANHVISSPEIDNIYALPDILDRQSLAEIVTHRLALSMPYRSEGKRRPPLAPYLGPRPQRRVRVALVGKYSTMRDSYVSIVNALLHCEPALDVKVEIAYLDTTPQDDPQTPLEPIDGFDGIIIPGGYGKRGTEGMIRYIQYAREHSVPLLGLCFGFQLAVMEFARHACGIEDATSTEFDAKAKNPIIALMSEQRLESAFGATQRLGDHEVTIKPGTIAHSLYGTDKTKERFRHRREFNLAYRERLEQAGLVFSGYTPDEKIMQILELPGHPFFLATQFHPEWKSRPLSPHPLYLGFVRACIARSEARLDGVAGASR